MKKLRDILYGVQIESIQGSPMQTIDKIVFDSRKATHKTLFVATKGGEFDGHNFINNAIDNGAVAVVCEEKPTAALEEIVWIKTQNSRAALAILASNFYDRPSSKLNLVGVTGTNGKTTIATLLYDLSSAVVSDENAESARGKFFFWSAVPVVSRSEMYSIFPLFFVFV